mgnify:CR=1 FL=1
MADFVAAVKAHAKLRCATKQIFSGDVEEFDEEKYAKMTYWVCAYAPNPLCAARRKAT